MSLRTFSTFGLVLVGLVACGEAGRSETSASGETVAASTATEQAPASARSVTRTFGNWTAVCDNGSNCSAYATAADAGSGWVMIRMDAGQAARAQAMVGDWSDTPGPLALNIDGRRVTGASSEQADGMDSSVVDRFADVTGFIDTVAQGQTLSIATADPEAGGSISLQGAAAALLWIDERQGRLGTTTALIRRGDRLASSVPEAPDLPVVQAAAAVSQAGLSDEPTLPASLETLPAVKACRADLDWGNGAAPPKDDGVARLSDDTLLWSVLCFQGPYNTGHRFFLTGNDGQNPRPVLLRSTDRQGDAAGEDDDYILINTGYSPKDRTISSFSKGRGLGDCGAAYVWTWTGREFVLTDERVMQRCAGMSADLWPTTWRTR